MKQYVLCSALILMVALSAFFSTQAGARDLISGTGTVRFIDLEGGFFGIISDDGQKFDPMNLDGEFQQSGLRVRFSGEVRTDVLGFHMWGTPLELSNIEKHADQTP